MATGELSRPPGRAHDDKVTTATSEKARALHFAAGPVGLAAELVGLKEALRAASARCLAAQEELIANFVVPGAAAAEDDAADVSNSLCHDGSSEPDTAGLTGSDFLPVALKEARTSVGSPRALAVPEAKSLGKAAPTDDLRRRSQTSHKSSAQHSGAHRTGRQDANVAAIVSHKSSTQHSGAHRSASDNGSPHPDDVVFHLTAFSGLASHRSMSTISIGSGDVEDSEVIGRRSSMRVQADVVLSSYERWSSWWSSLREPERKGPFARFVDGSFFQTMLVAVIISNGIFISHQTNYAAETMDEDITGPMLISELFFVSFFTLELVLKVFVHRLYFFIGEEAWWNRFDCIVVFVSILDFTFTYLNAFEGMNITILRLCRLFKLSKVFRMFRAFRFVGELRLLLKCVMGCFSSLFWSGIMLCFLKFLFGIYFVQSTTGFIRLEGRDADELTRDNLLAMFGSVQRAMLTLLKATTGGQDWTISYSVIEVTGIFGAAMFIFYIVFFMVAVWNIVTSIFIEKIMVMAAPNLEQEAFERRKQAEADTQALMEMVMKFDSNCSGTMSWHEFVRLYEDEKFRSYFTVRGIDIKDGETFFRMLTTVSGMEEVPLELFVNGCLRCKGSASCLDVHTLEYECKLMDRRNREFHQEMFDMISDIHDEMKRLWPEHSLAVPPPKSEHIEDIIWSRSFSRKGTNLSSNE